MSTGLFGPDPPRPQMRVPLSPASRLATRVRFVLTGLREPGFAAARRGVVRLAGGAALVELIGRFAVITLLREPTIVAGLAMAAFVTTRMAALTVVESRQMAFEPVWLAEQSAALRAVSFEVVRCTLNGRVVDLTEPGLGRTSAGWREPDSRVVLDITNGVDAIEQIHRRSRDMRFEFRPLHGPNTGPRVRFPQAAYELGPSGMSASWSLGSPVILTVAWRADPEAQRA